MKEEKKVIDMIDEKTRDLEVPETLQPEQMKRLLEGKKQKRWKPVYSYSAVAACLALVIGGVIYGQKMGDGQEQKEITVGPQIAVADTYEEIYNDFLQVENRRMTEYGIDSKSDTAKMTQEESAGTDQTNVRQEGVGEADTVKTDGSYIYTVKESAGEIAIIDGRSNDMQLKSMIKMESGAQVVEFYVQGDRLVVFYNFYPTVTEGNVLGEQTACNTYDISDRENPKEIGKVTQSGRYSTSRMVGEYVYIISQYHAAMEREKGDISTYIPSVQDKAIEPNCIYLPPNHDATQYSVITAMKISEPNQTIDEKAILTKGGNSYVSAENIYMYDTLYENTGDTTVIRKISYKDGVLTPKGQGELRGSIDDSFSIDEYNGYLRVLTTMNKRQIVALRSDNVVGQGEAQEPVNALFVLDDTLQIVGSIEDIAKGEEVKSARFMGDSGYFVTFKNMDPLFSVDLKDPGKPAILGALKIPGFSEYLHPYGEGLLLGIGLEVDEETGELQGVKLSMFDISNPADVKEIHKYIIDQTYNSSILYDYKSILLDMERQLVGITADAEEESYYLFKYSAEEGFREVFSQSTSMASYMSARGIYIEDRFYLVKGNTVQLFNMNSFEKMKDLIF